MTRTLWTAQEAAEATGGRLEGGDWAAGGVSIDTRTIEPGELFVALKDKRDGHDFAQAALDAGAAAALVSKPEACDGPKLVVDDVLEGLRRLGVAARDRCPAVRVGVTGSVGKTSVKEAIGAVFRAAGRAHRSVKSYNNHWGVPLTLARMPRDTERAVFEMGMNHAGEIRELTRLVRPQVALVTKIGPAHLEQLGSLEAIADAKSEIFEGLNGDGVAIIPADDDFAPRLAARARRAKPAFLFDFGVSPEAAVRVLSMEHGEDGGTCAFDVLGRRVSVRLALPGAHQAVNAAAVFAACAAAGVDPDLVAEVLSGLEPEAGRGASFDFRLADGGAVRVVDDSYNANPVSMGAAIARLGAERVRGAGRRIAVLGEMLELGPKSAEMHAELAGPLEAAGVQLVIGVGAGMRALVDALPAGATARYADAPQTALDMLTSELRDGDVVLIKGSNASGVHNIVASLREGAAVASSEV